MVSYAAIVVVTSLSPIRLKTKERTTIYKIDGKENAKK